MFNIHLANHEGLGLWDFTYTLGDYCMRIEGNYCSDLRWQLDILSSEGPSSYFLVLSFRNFCRVCCFGLADLRVCHVIELNFIYPDTRWLINHQESLGDSGISPQSIFSHLHFGGDIFIPILDQIATWKKWMTTLRDSYHRGFKIS